MFVLSICGFCLLGCCFFGVLIVLEQSKLNSLRQEIADIEREIRSLETSGRKSL